MDLYLDIRVLFFLFNFSYGGMALLREGLTVGIILLFIGVAAAPSINQSIVKASNDNRTIGSKITSQLVSIFFRRISDIFKRVDSIKNPLLYVIVFIISISRLIRGYFLFMISISLDEKLIEHPLLFLRSYWLLLTSVYWGKFWNNLSDSKGWNWPLLWS